MLFSDRKMTYQFIQCLDNRWEARSVRALLLPAVQHELMNRFRTIHRWRKPIILLDGLDHVLIGPSPVWPLAIWHDFPHDNAETPDIWGRSELAESDCLRGCPPDWNFATTCRVGAVDVGVRDLAWQTEVCDFAHKLRIDLKKDVTMKHFEQ